jgi:hypothetical protein
MKTKNIFYILLTCIFFQCKDDSGLTKYSVEKKPTGSPVFTKKLSGYGMDFELNSYKNNDSETLTISAMKNGKEKGLHSFPTSHVKDAFIVDADANKNPEIYIWRKDNDLKSIQGWSFEENGFRPIIVPDLEPKIKEGRTGQDSVYTYSGSIYQEFLVNTADKKIGRRTLIMNLIMIEAGPALKIEKAMTTTLK